LTIDKEIGKQCHICSFSNFTQRSPLHIAIEKDNVEMVQLVLEIALKQFTPMKFKAKKSEEKSAPLINNYDLSVMMRDMRVFLSYFDFR
jgi:ankyrin repeat protein